MLLTRRNFLAAGTAAVMGAPHPPRRLALVATSARASRNRPPQPAALVWDGFGGPHATDYGTPGGLVCVGRANYADAFSVELAERGASVLIYLDPIIGLSYGRYHRLLLEASRLGPKVGLWPGRPRANQWGLLNDFRVGSVLQRKFARLLQLMVSENPHIAGFFLDDLGTRSWFPGFDFDAWPRAEKQAYRAGAIALVRSARAVASANDLLVFVNGTWTAGDGGGYPNAHRHGCSLVDGGVIENHPASEIPFWRAYASSAQWAAATGRLPYMWTINDGDPATRSAYTRANIPAFATSQLDRDTPERPWGPIRDFGLPDGRAAGARRVRLDRHAPSRPA